MRARIQYILCFLLLIAGCKNDYTCNDPVPEYKVDKINYWLLRPKVGDTVIFKMYSRKKIDTATYKYTYLKNLTFIATDSFAEKFNVYNDYVLGSKCTGDLIDDRIVINFKGPEKLQCKLEPIGTSNAFLVIIFHNKDFRITNLFYNSSSNMIPRKIIGGIEYERVAFMTGYLDDGWNDKSTYVDSTYAFYNTFEGMLRFVVNDTLVYERYKP